MFLVVVLVVSVHFDDCACPSSREHLRRKKSKILIPFYRLADNENSLFGSELCSLIVYMQAVIFEGFVCEHVYRQQSQLR